jgi:D-alanyl-D-alanine dipeptidase
VDVTIAGVDGIQLDMGTPFDDLTELSHPSLEARFLREKALEPKHVENRSLLREVMGEGGWRGISTEWWHFDGGERVKIRAEYARVL